LNGFAHGCLQSGEREIAPGTAFEWARQGEALRVAFARQCLHLWSAGIGQAQELCSFVEGFAKGVINRCAEPQIIADSAHQLKLRVATRDEKQQIGERAFTQQARC
jgi:hypothetical protein